MPKLTMEARLKSLEQEVQELKQLVRGSARLTEPAPDWRRTLGMFTGDEIMKRIDEHARQYREADRRKARARTKRKVKS